MGRRAVIAGWCVALGCLPGCVGARLRREKAEEMTAAASERQELRVAATAAIDRGDYVQARADLVRWAARSARSAEPHFLLGKVLQLQDDLPEAEASYRRALAIEPQYVGALIGLGQVDARLDRPEAALRRFETAIEVDPRQPEAHFARGRVLERLGRADDALDAYFRTLELNPASAPAMVRVAALQLGQGQPDQALVRLDQASEIAPDDGEVRYQRGLVHLAKKEARPAVDDFRFAAERLGDRPDVLLGLALALEADRDPAQARLVADKALRLQPDSAVARDLSRRLRR